MPTVKGSKQERMMVVPYRPWHAFGVRACVVVLLLVTGSGGYYYGYEKSIAENGNATVELLALRDELVLTGSENADLRQQILNLEQAGTVDKQALDSVQQTILALREQNSQLEEDVLFYKQIMSPENSESGLVIGQIDLIVTETPGTIRYKLELKQQGTNENIISGYANVNVMGLQDGQEISIPLHRLSTTESSPDIRLQFRYFQNIEGELVLPADFEPTKIQIHAVAEGADGKTVQKSFGWIVEG